MKLTELCESKQPEAGTYVAVRFSKQSISDLIATCKQYDIPNLLDPDDFHATLIYSKTPAEGFKAIGEIDPPQVAKPQKFEIWPSSHITLDDGTHPKCLVLKIDAPDLVKRHKFIMDTYDTTYDYDEYIPHVTISYNVGGMKIADLPDPKQLKPLDITQEYSEDLKQDWGKSRT